MVEPETKVCVGALVRSDDSLLLVRQAKGHSLEGQWTIPWGVLDKGESPPAAVLREVREEGSIVARIEGLLGVQELPSPWKGQISLLYLCKHVSGNPRPDDYETDAAIYCSAKEFCDLKEPVEPLSAWLAKKYFSNDFTVKSADHTNPFHPTPGFF